MKTTKRGRPRKTPQPTITPSKTKLRDMVEEQALKIEKLEFIVEGLAHAIEFGLFDGVLMDTRRLLGK